MKISPLTSPRRAGSTAGSTVGAASTMMTPPQIPEISRQAKYHPTDTGNAEAKKLRLASSIMAFRTTRAGHHAANRRASTAPPR